MAECGDQSKYYLAKIQVYSSRDNSIMKLKLRQLRQYLAQNVHSFMQKRLAQVCEYVITNIYRNLANVAQLYKDNGDENDENIGEEWQKPGLFTIINHADL